MRRTIMALTGIVLLTAGCVPSLHPLYTEKDLVFEPALLGTWLEEGGNSFTFSRAGEKQYDLIYMEKGVPAAFDACLVQLGGFWFLDSYPKPLPFNNGYYQIHLVPAHVFSRIWVEDQTLYFIPLSYDGVKNVIDGGAALPAHEWMDKDLVLTGVTAELQEFILQYAQDGAVFADTTQAQRQ